MRSNPLAKRKRLVKKVDFMKTLIKEIDINKPDQDLISLFATMLADGKTVIFPTETVYGLGANALDEMLQPRYISQG